ncbi:substrate-binding domain-containing protein [Halioxenophilus aromaticivorans]|uniref:Sugar-binding protein n=1 Tax=Halioxenophilus aromaticivorans TaxID=1306992 RepID=A0AAV3U3I1_9ALTE
MKNTNYLVAVLAFFLVNFSGNVAKAAKSDNTLYNYVKSEHQSGKRVYGIVPKQTGGPFFSEIEKGCMDAAEQIGVTCLYFGEQQKDARAQLKAIQALMDANVDGLAIAGLRTDWIHKTIGKQLKDWGKPIIGFDSPLSMELARAYVGTHNYLLGRALGREIVKLKPNGGSYCIHAERPDSPNHNDRIRGVEDIFRESNNPGHWQGIAACPIRHFGHAELGAKQMKRILNKFAPDIFISTGGGAQFVPQTYRKLVSPWRDKIASGELVIASIDTTPGQVELLKEGLATINVGQKPYEMGYWAVTLLNMHDNGQPIPLVVNTGLTLCDQRNYATCAQQKPITFKVNEVKQNLTIGQIRRPQS